MFDPSKYLVGVRTVPDVIENVSAYQLKGDVASYRVSTGSGEIAQGSAYADIGDANVLIASAVEIRICAGIIAPWCSRFILALSSIGCYGCWGDC